MRTKLEAPELGAAMAKLPGWELAEGKLRRRLPRGADAGTPAR